MAELAGIKLRLNENGGKLVGYARVSTDDQDCALQINQLKQIGCQKIYADYKTGTTVKRYQLEQCLDYLLGRSLKDLITISDDLRTRGIALFILQQNLDTSTPMGQMFYSMLGIMSEFEYHLKRERQMEGIAKAKQDKKYKGRKPLDESKIKEIRKLLENKVPISAISKELKVGRTSIYKYLR